jgi:hypothetical protein
MQVVKILLRHRPTGLYVRDWTQWTGDPGQALDFKAMRRAIQFAEETGFSHMELAIVSEKPPHLTVVPVTALTCRRVSGASIPPARAA